MKKLTLALGVFVSTFFAANAQQCTIDPSSIPAGAFSYPDSLPCVVQGEDYSQTVQLKLPGTIDTSIGGMAVALRIDSVVITGVSGLPTDIAVWFNPAYNGDSTQGVFYGDSAGCFKVVGTTNDPVDNYPATLDGTIYVTDMGSSPAVLGMMVQIFPGITSGGSASTTLAALASVSSLLPIDLSFLSLSLDVIAPGAPCHPDTSSGISTVNSFNAIINVFPNPASNLLNVNINTVDRINGNIAIFDMLGRAVYTEKIDYLGLISKQINVASFGKGVYSLQITNNKNAYKTKFVVE